MKRIDTGRITLNCADLGEGPAFVFIPGLVGLYDAWSFQLEHFSKRYRCVTFDHRGTGESDKPTGVGAYSTQAIADDVIALMDTLDIDRAHIVGTSTGGCILQNLALDHPDRVRACIFNNTWVTADEFITRVAVTRKRIAESYGPEEYVKVSSMFTSGADQFRHNLDAVMELERRALETVLIESSGNGYLRRKAAQSLRLSLPAETACTLFRTVFEREADINFAKFLGDMIAQLCH